MEMELWLKSDSLARDCDDIGFMLMSTVGPHFVIKPQSNALKERAGEEEAGELCHSYQI
jgi:hypothetical protein